MSARMNAIDTLYSATKKGVQAATGAMGGGSTGKSLLKSRPMPDITVGPTRGPATVRDRGNAGANRRAIIRKAERRGYPPRAIQKRYGS